MKEAKKKSINFSSLPLATSHHGQSFNEMANKGSFPPSHTHIYSQFSLYEISLGKRHCSSFDFVSEHGGHSAIDVKSKQKK